MIGRAFLVAAVCLSFANLAVAQPAQRPAEPPAEPAPQRPRAGEESLHFMEEALAKKLDDLMLFRRLEDIAVVDKVRYTGPPPRVIKNPTGQGAGNPVIIWAYTFLPKKHPSVGKLPLMVYVHGGVHGNL